MPGFPLFYVPGCYAVVSYPILMSSTGILKSFQQECSEVLVTDILLIFAAKESKLLFKLSLVSRRLPCLILQKQGMTPVNSFQQKSVEADAVVHDWLKCQSIPQYSSMTCIVEMKNYCLKEIRSFHILLIACESHKYCDMGHVFQKEWKVYP